MPSDHASESGEASRCHFLSILEQGAAEDLRALHMLCRVFESSCRVEKSVVQVNYLTRGSKKDRAWLLSGNGHKQDFFCKHVICHENGEVLEQVQRSCRVFSFCIHNLMTESSETVCCSRPCLGPDLQRPLPAFTIMWLKPKQIKIPGSWNNTLIVLSFLLFLSTRSVINFCEQCKRMGNVLVGLFVNITGWFALLFGCQIMIQWDGDLLLGDPAATVQILSNFLKNVWILFCLFVLADFGDYDQYESQDFLQRFALFPGVSTYVKLIHLNS